MRRLEIIATSAADAIQAHAGGASSIEVVENMTVGGLTPALELVQAIRAAVTIPIRVIVRPHAGNFRYSAQEIDRMLGDVEALKRVGVNGIVFGALKADNSVDLALTAQIAQAAQPLELTFHRAIDLSRDASTALPMLIPLVQRILTSGLADNVWEGRHMIGQWVARYGDRVTFACGGGLLLEQLAEVVRTTSAPEYHFGSAARTNLQVDERKVRQMRQVLELDEY